MSITEKRPVIEVTGLKKQYKLGQIGGGTLTHDLQSWWARVRGKEDPNTVIGTDQRLFGQTFMALNGVDLTVYQGGGAGHHRPQRRGQIYAVKAAVPHHGPHRGRDQNSRPRGLDAGGRHRLQQ